MIPIRTNFQHFQKEQDHQIDIDCQLKVQRKDCLFYDTSARHERHECQTNDTNTTRVKNLDFDNATSENIFSHSYISYIANEKLQGRGNFILRTSFLKCLLLMPKCAVKVHHRN